MGTEIKSINGIPLCDSTARRAIEKAKEEFQPKGEYLTEHQKLKSINGQSLVGEGDITISGEGSVDLTGYAKSEDIPSKVSELENDKGFLTQHQSIKTINGQSLVGEGNLTISGSGSVSTVEADFKADVYMIPCYGQSLAVGTSGGTTTFSYKEPLAYNVNLVNDNVQDMCAGTAEAFRIAADYYGITLPEKFKVIVCKDGAGGKSVAQLAKGTSYYTSLINHVKTAKASCDAAGLTMIVPCFTWTQGEEDMRCGGTAASYGSGTWNPFTYKDRLKTLIENLNTDIKAITGQTEDVLCISYQLTAHTSYSRYPRIALQLEELAEEYDKMVMAKVMYDLEYVTEGTSQVHAYNRSYRNIGNLYGIAAFNASVLNKRKRWCYPIDYTIHGNKVTIRFDTPFRPLVLDTKLINQLPDGNYGFNIYNVVEASGNSGSSIAEAETRITNVRLRGDDTVELTLSRTPIEGERLTYGVNGDYWQNVNGAKTVLEGGEGEDGYCKAGWQYGARGCLRDSQPFKNNNSGATLKNLYNWCVLFEIPFTNENLGGGTSSGGSGEVIDPANSCTLIVTPTPADAVVKINGVERSSAAVEIGTTATWEVSMPGYVTQTGTQEMTKDTAITVELTALPQYTVTINPIPSDAEVIIEDEGGKTSITTYEGATISWVVSKEGYITKTGTHVVTKDETITVELVDMSNVDVDAQAYLTAANITDTEQIGKVDTLVTSLKSEGLWDKIDALYPLLGDTFEQMSYNLKDPSAYKLKTSGTPTVVANKSISCTAQIQSDLPASVPGSDFHIMGHSFSKRSDNDAGLVVPGPSSGGGYDSSKGGVMILVGSSYVAIRTTSTNKWQASTTVDGDGLFIGSLTSGLVLNGKDLGATKSGTPSVTKWGTTESAFMYNGYNSTSTAGKVEGSITTGIAGFGKGLTIEEMETYSAILNEFKQMYTEVQEYTLTVSATPSDATVKLNGVEQTSITVAEGSEVQWEVSKDGYVAQSGTVTVTSDTTLPVTLVEAAEYTFTITATPDNSIVKINGVEQKSITVPEGTSVEYEVSCEGYYSESGSCIVDKDTNIVVDLTSESDVDTDAEVFLTAANITDSEQSGKIDTLVKSLKANNLWDKIDALYPMIGSTFEQMSYNLKDPTTYKLRTSGTPTIVADTSMACSKQIVSDIPATDPGTDFHIMGSSVTKRAETSGGLLVPGPSNSNGYDRNGVMILIGAAYIQMRTSKSDNWKATTTVDGDGLVIGSITSGIVYNGADTAAVKSGSPSVTLYRSTDNAFQYNCYNSTTTVGKVENPFTTRLAGFGKGLTIEEMQTYSEILNEFKQVYTTA